MSAHSSVSTAIILTAIKYLKKYLLQDYLPVIFLGNMFFNGKHNWIS